MQKTLEDIEWEKIIKLKNKYKVNLDNTEKVNTQLNKNLENEDKFTINMYAGARQNDATAMSGYIPTNKVLLFSRTYESNAAKYIVFDSYSIIAYAGGVDENRKRHHHAPGDQFQSAFPQKGIPLVATARL